MPNGLIVPGFFSSPSDAKQLRQRAIHILLEWNDANTLRLGCIGHPVIGDHARSTFGEHPQSEINRQLIGPCDFLIAVFQWELGTRTDNAPSGTVEEIEEFFKQKQDGTKICIYFSTKDRPLAEDPRLREIHREQYNRLRDYQKSIQQRCLYRTFDTEQEFERLLRHDLNDIMHAINEGRYTIDISGLDPSEAEVVTTPMTTAIPPTESPATIEPQLTPRAPSASTSSQAILRADGQAIIDAMTEQEQMLDLCWDLNSSQGDKAQVLFNIQESLASTYRAHSANFSLQTQEEFNKVFAWLRSTRSPLTRREPVPLNSIASFPTDFRRKLAHLRRVIALSCKLPSDENLTPKQKEAQLILKLADWILGTGELVDNAIELCKKNDDKMGILMELSEFRERLTNRVEKLGVNWLHSRAERNVHSFCDWLFSRHEAFDKFPPAFYQDFHKLYRQTAAVLRGAAIDSE